MGDGTTATPLLPMPIGSASDWSTLSLGTSASCATKANGSLYCWGNNVYGQLGDGSTSNRTTPTAVQTGLAWASVSVGGQAACGVPGAPAAPPPLPALPPAPPVFDAPNCWGSNAAGQFGNGSTGGLRLSPTSSTTAVWERHSLSDTAACAIQRGVQHLYCWGSDPNGLGGLGDGAASSHYLPLQVSGGGQWTAVSASAGLSCGIRTNGSLFCWGFNRYFGEVGDNTTSTRRAAPVLIGPSSATWAALPPRGFDSSFMCAIQSNLSLWCWVSCARMAYSACGVLGQLSHFRHACFRAGMRSVK